MSRGKPAIPAGEFPGGRDTSKAKALRVGSPTWHLHEDYCLQRTEQTFVNYATAAFKAVGQVLISLRYRWRSWVKEVT